MEEDIVTITGIIIRVGIITMEITTRVETMEVEDLMEIITRDSMVAMEISSSVAVTVEIMITMVCRVVLLIPVAATRMIMMERASPRDLIVSSRVSTRSLSDCRVPPRMSLGPEEEGAVGLPLVPLDKAGVETGSRRTEEKSCYLRLLLANTMTLLLLRRICWRFFASF